MLCLQKNNSFLSFHWPIFHSKIHKRRGTFFERRGSLLKRTYVEGKTCKTNRDKQVGKGVKNWKFRANVLFEWPRDGSSLKHRRTDVQVGLQKNEKYKKLWCSECCELFPTPHNEYISFYYNFKKFPKSIYTRGCLFSWFL